jgi:ABC-2 type transport system permease protein
MTRTILKYGAFLRIAFVEARRARSELWGRALFFVVILGVFTNLWAAIEETGMPIDAEPRSLVWYLAMTEWILLSAPSIHLELQESIRRGDVVCQLARPVSFVGAAMAEGVGALLVRSPVLFAIGCVSSFVLTRSLPPVAVLAVIVPLGLVASALITAIFFGLGLLAFWLSDASPLWWVSQKLLFVLGGMMMPLSLYPPVIQRVAALTPFPAVLAGPATLVMTGRTDGAGRVALVLVAWTVVTGVALELVFRRAVRTMTANGG